PSRAPRCAPRAPAPLPTRRPSDLAGHPAVRFLLLLAIADDAGGLIILAIFYPTWELAPAWLLLSLGAALAVFILFNWLLRRLDRARNSTRLTSRHVQRPYAAFCLT